MTFAAFETLRQAQGVYSTGRESHWLETVSGLSPGERGWSSNQLAAADATDARVRLLTEKFYSYLQDRDGRAAQGPVRMLEKTPKNALRVPFLDAAFAQATFVYLYRDVRETLSFPTFAQSFSVERVPRTVAQVLHFVFHPSSN